MAETKTIPGFCPLEPTEAMKAMQAEYETEWSRNRRSLIKQYHITDYDEAVCTELNDVRRPLVLVRGKPISREQVMQLIVGEEPLFGKGSDNKDSWFDPRSDRGMLKNIFYRQGYNWLSTWVYTDGTIGGNLIHLGKYPELEDFLPMYADLAGKYPFLDMVVSYTLEDESCCGRCNVDSPTLFIPLCKSTDCIPYLDKIRTHSFSKTMRHSESFDFEALYYSFWSHSHVRSDVDDSVCLTIWIRDGHVEILFGNRAASKFNEYNSLYCAPEYAFMFSSSLYDYRHTCVCDKQFVENCFEFIEKPGSLCEEYEERGFISPFNENAIVVTKDWVISQYYTYIAAGGERY